MGGHLASHEGVGRTQLVDVLGDCTEIETGGRQYGRNELFVYDGTDYIDAARDQLAVEVPLALTKDTPDVPQE